MEQRPISTLVRTCDGIIVNGAASIRGRLKQMLVEALKRCVSFQYNKRSLPLTELNGENRFLSFYAPLA